MSAFLSFVLCDRKGKDLHLGWVQLLRVQDSVQLLNSGELSPQEQKQVPENT